MVRHRSSVLRFTFEWEDKLKDKDYGKRIEVFNGKTYEQVFISPDADMGKACGELCCFSVMTSDGPRCMSHVD